MKGTLLVQKCVFRFKEKNENRKSFERVLQEKQKRNRLNYICYYFLHLCLEFDFIKINYKLGKFKNDFLS